MAPKRKIIKDGVRPQAKVRKHKRDHALNFTSKGWEVLFKSATLKWKNLEPRGLEFPTHPIWKTSSPYTIFKKFLPNSLLDYVLNAKIIENEKAIRLNKGGSRTWNVKFTKHLFLLFFAAKIFLHILKKINGVGDDF